MRQKSVASLLAFAGIAMVCMVTVSPTKVLAQDETEPDDLTAEQILERTAEMYATCSSYYDLGVAIKKSYSSNRVTTDEFTFRTAFIRPGQFRFECKGYDIIDQRRRRHILWCDGGEIRRFSDGKPDTDQLENLLTMMEWAAFLPGNSVRYIPERLLSIEGTGFSLNNMSNLTRLDDATLEGVICFVVQGDVSFGQRTFWISKADFLLQRIDWRKTVGEHNITTGSINYYPVINRDIEDTSIFRQYDDPEYLRMAYEASDAGSWLDDPRIPVAVRQAARRAERVRLEDLPYNTSRAVAGASQDVWKIFVEKLEIVCLVVFAFVLVGIGLLFISVRRRRKRTSI